MNLSNYPVKSPESFVLHGSGMLGDRTMTVYPVFEFGHTEADGFTNYATNGLPIHL
jgi:hypothetical protein